MPEIKDTPENVAYRVGQLEIADEKKELRIQALELWKAGVESTVRALKSGDPDHNVYAPTAKEWVKIILTILGILAAVVTFITTRGG